MNVVEQVREGLKDKIKNLNIALTFVRDPREVERLSKELKGATEALEKLNKPDTRTQEELEKLGAMISDTASIETPIKWSKMPPIDKFKYQIDIYCKKLTEACEGAKAQREGLTKIVDFLSGVDFEECNYMESLYVQFANSLCELNFSIDSLEGQIKLKDEALAVIDKTFDAFDIVNRFLNNPMALPHITDEREARLAEVGNAQKK